MVRPWFVSYPRIITAIALWSLSVLIIISLLCYDPYEPSILYASSDVFPPAWYVYIMNSIAALYVHILGWSGIGLLAVMALCACVIIKFVQVSYNALVSAVILCCFNAMWCVHIGYEPCAQVAPGGWVGQWLYACCAFLCGEYDIDCILRGMMACAGLATFKFRWIRYVMPYVQTAYTSTVQPAVTYAACVIRSGQRRVFPSLLHEHIARENTEGQASQTDIFHDAFWSQTHKRSTSSRAESMYGESRQPHTSPTVTRDDADTVSSSSKSAHTAHACQGVDQHDAGTNNSASPHMSGVTHPQPGLLADGDPVTSDPDDTAYQQARQLEEKLATFGITGRVTHITCGPIVTIFSYQPDKAVKVAHITAREDDLRLALEAVSLRIIAPIPGTSVVGFEVSRPQPQSVMCKHVIEDATFWSDTTALPLALGTDTAGKPFISDLTAMPHVLVAGSTGSGKSVSLHGFLISLLYRCHPDHTKLVLIDPKRLEFAPYHDIPHRATPVITQPRSVVKTFEWLVQEMERRYDELAQAGVRNITEYHDRYGVHHMPYLVVVVDELADVMMGVGKDIEQYIARLAQMARAAGIHLIVATQRPSVDVVTGMIKVNFLSRIAFKVTSKIDSRTIIDQPGAQKLLGRGDMLHLDARGVMHRLHGGYITQAEIDAVIQHWSRQPYTHTYLFDPAASSPSHDNEEEDALYADVAAYVSTCETVSISLIQRRFRIGYNRSARLMDALERHSVVSSADTNKMRKVLQ